MPAAHRLERIMRDAIRIEECNLLKKCETYKESDGVFVIVKKHDVNGALVEMQALLL